MSATTDLPPSLAERFWSHSAGRESEDLPEPERSVAVVRNFLSALERLDVPVLIAMLRRAEVEGDLSYASPEQVRGENLDARAIVFSLGVVLFERLTGRHPFGAENNRPRRVDRIRRGEMGSGVNSFPTIPGGIRTVLVRAMSPFAEERWPDLRELRSALRHATPDEMQPPPKLPGASEDRDVTKVVRMPTEFGQELMKVVADHDGSAGAGAKPGAAAAPAGAKRTGRTSAPPETSVSAKVEVAKVEVAPAKVEVAPAKVEVAPAKAAPRPALEPAVDESPRRPSTVTIPDLAPAPPRTRIGVIAGIAAAAGAAIAVIVMIVLRPPAAKPAPAGGADLGPAPEVAAAPAVVEPAGDPPVHPAPPPSVPAAPITRAEPTPAPSPSPSPTPSPSPSPPPAPTPSPSPPPAADTTPGTVVDKLTGIITGCLAQPIKVRGFGFSIMYKDRTAGKTYFDPDGPLAKDERTCISTAVRGMTADDAPDAGDALYAVRITDGAVAIKSRTVRPVD